MLETLSEETQSKAAEHLREWLADMEDETVWDGQFADRPERLYAAARQVRQQIAEGKAQPLDFDRR